MLRQRLRAWFENRLPRSDSQTLTQRNLYILPTKAGWGFCLTLVVMLLASINYQLNLGYALTFLLGGTALVSLHQTHGNLRRLGLRIKAPAPVFAGEPATLEIVIDNPGGERHGVGLALHDARREGIAFCDVPAQGSAQLRLRFTPATRGRQALPTLLVETHFPLGLFRAWTVWRPASQALVYPAPEQPAQPLPAGRPSERGELQARSGSGGEFDGVRAYRRGDPLRQVVWKKVARAGELVSRDTSASAAQALVLDYGAIATPRGGEDSEARLSRLAAWVLAAERLGQAFALKLPGLDLPAAGGEAQRRAALEALALWQPARRSGAAA
ncbi:MAG: DUF58 domain-containing protein [Burkholderiaceae bacterium]|nr:DUF58 domain-containing protein [Burkholderiaceae bacterium]